MATSDGIPQRMREMKVNICPLGLDFWEYEGTRAQLEAEGIIPPETQWPEGTGDHYFNAGPFEFWLRRTRPDDLRGPMRLWTNGDWWMLRCTLLERKDHATREILKKKRELEQAIYRNSLQGQREASMQFARLLKARQDEAFRAFKAKVVPERRRPRRDRTNIGPQPKAIPHESDTQS